jgi:HSP20 family protein
MIRRYPMSLRRPSQTFETMQREFDQLVRNMLGPSTFDTSSGETDRPTVVLPLDIAEDEGAYLIEADVPGFSREELEISLDGRELTIAGRHVEEVEESPSEVGADAPAESAPSLRYHRRERRAVDVQRRLVLPEDVQSDGIEASLEHGVLRLRLPKAEEAKPRRIDIAGSGSAHN